MTVRDGLSGSVRESSTRRTKVRRRRRRAVVALVSVAVLLAAGFAVRFALQQAAPRPPAGCTAAGDGTTYRLTLEQAGNAATIAAVGQQRGMPDHAVTVALATSLQEAKLRNLPFGDRDSVGLFQQRPSQGWGTQEQLMDPRYAAGEFYAHLVAVPGWQTLAVAQAAQAVQRSADGAAYAKWEPVARLLARTLTGELPRGLTCSYDVGAPPPPAARSLGAAIAAERGARAVQTTVSPQAGWATSAWLVARAAEHRVASVTFAGWTWTASSGRWTAQGSPALVVTYTLVGTTG